MSSLPVSAEMRKGCLFPDFIPNRDVSQRYLTKLTREGFSSLGGFHCLPRKDRVTWGSYYIVYVYYINMQTVVREVDEGYRCVHLHWELFTFVLKLPKSDTEPNWQVPVQELDL